MIKTSNGKSIDISKAKEIAAGGEGKIVEYPSNPNKVLKIYHQPKKNSFDTHLKSLASLSSYFVKPEEVFYNSNQQVIGFSMDFINFNDYHLFNNLFNKGFCTSNALLKPFKIKLLEKLKSALEELHGKDIVVGDLNMYNIFFSTKGELLFVDVDSYQTQTNPHSGVLLDQIRDWTTTNISKETDIWAYNILAFWSCCYVHPFQWVAPGNKDTLEQRVRQGKSILTKIPNLKIPALYEAPTGQIESQFKDIFHGRRYFVDFTGSIQAVPNVIKQAIASTALTIRELFNHVTQVNVTGDFIAVKANNIWSYVETKIPKVTRVISTGTKFPLFPSNTNPVMLHGKDLLSDKGEFKPISFIQPEFFYYNGFLTVIDYGTDIQYNFNLNNQLGGIDQRQTPVFAKSIVIRDTPIQNFGAKKYLNIPINNSYTLIEVPLGTKNATFNGVFYCVEHLENKQVKFTMRTVGHNTLLELDYLPYFTSKLQTLFIPEDGKIDVYKDFTLIASMDCSMCTRSSKLYSCNSGILLLENNILYLLNTK